MKSIKTKLTTVLTTVSFIVMVLTILTLIIILLLHKYNEEKAEIKTLMSLVKSDLSHFSEDALSHPTQQNALKLKFSEISDNRSQDHAFRIYNQSGKTIFKYPADSEHYSLIRKSDVKDNKFHTEFLSINDWFYFQLIDTPWGSALISCRHRLVFFETALIAFLCLLPVVCLLTWVTSRVISNRLLGHIVKVNDAAAAISAGNLKTRIPDYNNNDELGLLTENLNKAFSELNNAIDHIKRFSADVSHELKTPLTVLLSTLELNLSKDSSVEDYKTCLFETIDELTKMKSIINTLLLISNPENNTAENLQTYNLSTQILEELPDWEVMAASKNIKTMTDISEGLYILGNSSFIQRALQNIIHNAIKFSNHNSTVTIRLYSEDGKIIFSVADEGSGILRGDLPHLFTRFYKGSNSKTGSGLGLALVKWIIVLHKGEISIANNSPQGTIVQFSLLASSNSSLHKDT